MKNLIALALLAVAVDGDDDWKLQQLPHDITGPARIGPRDVRSRKAW